LRFYKLNKTMAVYKKKDKTAKSIQKDRAKIAAESTTKEVFEGLDSGASKAEEWILRNQKIILTAMGIIVLGVFAYMGYSRFVKEPAELEAANELAFPKAYFDKALTNTVVTDSLYTLALNGADGKEGLIGIADKYGSTKAGNLAKYCAGISYLKINEYKKAIEYLDDFSSDDVLLGTQATGAIGDAFANLGDEYLDDALNYYEKAANTNPNEYSTAFFLNKAATIALSLGKNTKAETFYTRIKNEYPNTPESVDIDGKINQVKYAAK